MITSLLADELFMILLGITTMILGVGSTVLSILGVHTLTNRIRTILTWIWLSFDTFVHCGARIQCHSFQIKKGCNNYDYITSVQ